ncbi:MAG: hypothetical protein RJA63_78 [Pseudomonadota bacterium]|jgi:ribosomal protein S27E
MAGKLSEIRASSPAAAITGAELIEVTQDGATKVATVDEILAALDAGGVTSVALSLPTELTVSGSPVTASGTLSADWADQTAAKVLASPASSTGAPSFRALAATDLPSHTHPEAQRIGVNNQTGTTYTAVFSDAGKMVRCSNAAAIALTLPTGGVFTVGDVVMVRQVGAGQVTVSGGTLNIPTGVTAKTRVQGSVMSLHYVAVDTWDVLGDLA